MKSQIKRFSKSTMSVILAFCMLISCLTVGMIATDAAYDRSEAVGDTTYYMHIGVQSAFRTSDGIAFTYDSTNSLYYASYELTANSEYPMVICTTSGSLGDGQKSSSNQSVTTKADAWNPDSIQFDYFSYSSNNYDGYDCFKFKTKTTQTVYFTFTAAGSGLVVRSSLPSGGGDDPEPSGDTTTDTINQTSGKTILVSWDTNTSYVWDYVYFYSGFDTGHYSMTAPASPNPTATYPEVYYKTLYDSGTGTTAIKFILEEDGSWAGQSANIEPSGFTKGKQWYTIRTTTGHSGKPSPDSNGEYTALKLSTITTPSSIIKDTENSLTVNVDGGLPWFLSSKRSVTTGKYKLTVTDNDTQIFTKDDVLYATKSFTVPWTPSSSGSHTLVYTLTDGIDTVSYSKAYTVVDTACTSVSLSQSPSNGAIYENETSVTYTATAESPESGVTYNFKVDGTSVQNTSSTTYSTTFTSAGTKSVTVTVEKSGYGSVTSSAVSTEVISRPAVYLRGLTNDYTWNEDDANKMTYNPTTELYEIMRNLYSGATTYNDGNGFKFYHDSTYYGKDSTTITSSSTTATELSSSGGNINLTTKDLSSVTSSKVPYKFTYNKSTQAMAVYYPMKVTYNMQDHGTNPSANGYVVAYGSTITAPTAPTEAGYTFGGWYKEAACTNAWDFSTDTVTEDTVLYAKWTQDSYAITYPTETNFSISNKSHASSAHYGDTVSFTVTPSSGYRITGVTYTPTGGSAQNCTAGSNNTYSFTMPAANVTISVSTVQTYTVTLTAGEGFDSRQYKLGSSGTYQSYTSGTTLTVDAGTDVYFKVTYSTGYQYSSNSELTVVTANTEFRTGSVTANKTTTITASKINYTVTLNKNASDATAGTASVTATYGDAMPTASVTMPTRTGYTFAGYYDTSAATGGTQYYTAAGASARNWNKTSNTTLYARWTEITGGAIAKAYTSGSASSTGGTVKVGASGTAGATANLSAIGIASSNTVIATKGSHYDFAGWQFSGTKCANLRYRFSDSGAWLTPAEGTTYGTASNTTIYIKTDGSTGITTANAEIHALFTPTQYSLTGVTSPAGKGSVEFYSDLSCEQQINPAVANYGNTVYAKYDPGESGYVLKSFSVSGTGASLGTRNGNIIPVTVGSANVIVTANVMLQYSVTYYVDMHSNEINSLSFAVVAKTGTNTYSVIKDNDNDDCIATLGDAQGKYQLTKQGSSKVYAAAIATPVTLSGSTYSDLYFRITFNGTDYIKKISGGNTSATNCIVDDLINSGEIWLEAKNDPSTPLTVNYATNSEAAVPAAGFRRIYLARPYKWYYTEGNEEKGTNTEWNQIGIYHWGNYPDIGWNECTKMNKLGYSGTGENDYYYYYVDIPKAINGNKVSNIIFQGWGSNQEAGTYSKAQTDNIENIPDSANFYILSKDGNAFVGTKSEEDAVIANYTRYVSSVTMNNTETTAVNIKPTYTGADVTYTSGDEGVVTVDDSGIITPVGRGTTTITAKIYGTIGALVTNEDTTYKDYMIRTTTITVNDPTHLSTDGFEIMSLQSETYTVSIPSIDSDQPGYFDFSNDDMVFTVTGLKGVNKSTNSAIIFDISTGAQPNSFKIKYAKANTVFSGYSGIRVVGDIVTKSILNTSSGKRYGLDYWKKYTGSTAANPNPNYTNSKTIDNGVETVVTKGIIFGKDDSDNNVYDRFEAIFAEYDYVDVTFTFTYWEYNPQKVDVNETPLDDSDDMINYFYDATWAGGEDTSNANFAASHTQKTVTVQNYEVRGKTASNVQAADLVTPARTAIGVRPDNNYYNYSIEASNIIIPESDRDPDHFTANAAVNIAHSVKHYSVYLNGSTIVGTDYTYQQYVEVAPTNQPSDTLWYAVGKNSTAVDTSTDPLLATGSSYKFRVKGNTYLRTVEGSVTDQNFNRSEVDFSHYEVTHRDNTSKEYLLQNFYIADFFSPAKVLDPNSNNGQGNLPYDDAQFVGGGVVYYSMNGATENNQGTPFANAVSSGYVNGDSSSADYGKINDTAIKEMLKSNIEAQYAKDNIAGTVGEEDAMKAAYGTEIAATKNVEGGFNTGIIYRYLPLNQYTRYGSDEKTVDITVNNGSNITNYTLTTKDQTTQKWGYSISQTSTDDPEIANGKRTIRFTNNQNWDAVFVHFWGGSSASNWPGIRMTDKDNNVFEAVIPADATQIVFNDGCSMPATDENGSYTLDYSVNKNTFRYSNSLQSYQYVYASGNENKATNAGKNMRLYSYYVYSYVTYDQETNVPVTKYEIVLSDNYSDASTYWEGNPNPDPSN